MEISAAHGLNPGAMNALLFLQPGEAVFDADPSRTLGSANASNVTWLVDRLEERGLAERRPHPHRSPACVPSHSTRKRHGGVAPGQIEAQLFEAPPGAPHAQRDRTLETLNRIMRKLASPAETLS